ncbi:AMP-binding protein [Occultella kanbiaonis]|uniref:AMP-binding protein n=1 Tax=Occultella kanbiaonis TaxID=2675754 RepID=UPI0013D6196C|nr:AMP-binding protein [Occultella kanbiaonis]
MSHRSGWHAVPEAAAVLGAMAPRPADLPAVGPLWRYGTTLPGAALAAARRSPHGPVLVDHQGPLDGEGLAREVEVAAARLTGELHAARAARGAAGGEPAPRIAVHARDHRGQVATVIAAGALGVDVVLIGPSVGTTRLRSILGRTRPDVVVHDDATAAGLAAALDPGTRQYDCSPRPDPAAVREEPSGGPAHPADRWRRRRVGTLHLLSSGTTHTPHATARPGVRRGQLGTVLSLLAALGLRRGEPVLVTAPLSHGHGLSVFSAALVIGAPVLLGHGQSAERLAELINTHGVGAVLGVPAQLQALVQVLETHSPRPPLRRIAAGSAPLSIDLAARIEALYPGALVDFFGTSETGTATIATAADLRDAPGTVGRPATGVCLRIRDDDGTDVPDGVTGRLWLRSPWRAADTQRGFVATGDVGHLDAKGRLFLAGRADDIVVVGGHNVHLGEVRDWFLRQHEVSDAVVHAVPDECLGQVLRVEVSGVGVDDEVLLGRARAELGSARAPRRVDTVGAGQAHTTPGHRGLGPSPHEGKSRVSQTDVPTIVRNDAVGQYEIWVGGTRAGIAAFHTEAAGTGFSHTLVDDEFAGQGLGSALARGALDDTVARGETIVPYCPFIAAYLRRHHDYDDSVHWPDPAQGR